MPFTEFVLPTLKSDPATEALFTTELAPLLLNILDKHTGPPKHKFFGKILLENGNDVSGDFRLCVGLGSSFPFLSTSSIPFLFPVSTTSDPVLLSSPFPSQHF